MMTTNWTVGATVTVELGVERRKVACQVRQVEVEDSHTLAVWVSDSPMVHQILVDRETGMQVSFAEDDFPRNTSEYDW